MYTVLVVQGWGASVVTVGAAVWVASLIGQTVVYRGIVSVVTYPPAGQSVTYAGHLVTVCTEVV